MRRTEGGGGDKPIRYSEGIRTLARLSRVAETSFQEAGISLPQYRLLVALAAAPQRAGVLAAQLGVTRPTLSSLVGGLERSGLLRRVPVQSDRRGVLLEATDAGERAVGRAEQTFSDRLSALVDRERAAGVTEFVDQVASALDEGR